MSEITKDDIRQYFHSKSDDVVPVSEARKQLAERHGADQSDVAGVLFKTTESVEVDGGAGVRLLDDLADGDDMAAGNRGGTAPGMESDSISAADSDDTQADIETIDWSAQTDDKIEIGKIDQDTGSPVDDEFYHLNVRESVGHPLVPEVPQYITQEYAEGVSDVEAFTAFMTDSDFGAQLIGEPGTGKGHMVKFACMQANIPLVRVNMGMGMTRSKLVGRFVPRNGDSGIEDQLERAKDFAADEDVSVEKALEIMNVREKFEWRDGLLTAAVKHGFWFLADELNAADAELLLPFNGLLEDDDSRSLEITEKAQQIDPHPGFKLVATRNPKHHEGTKRQNHAFIDRLYDMWVDYLPADTEAKLLADQEPVSEDEAGKLVKLAQSVRNAYPHKIDHMTLTFRGLQRIARRTRVFSVEEAARQELLEGFDAYHTEGDEAAEAVQRKLDQIFG